MSPSKSKDSIRSNSSSFVLGSRLRIVFAPSITPVAHRHTARTKVNGVWFRQAADIGDHVFVMTHKPCGKRLSAPSMERLARVRHLGVVGTEVNSDPLPQLLEQLDPLVIREL